MCASSLLSRMKACSFSVCLPWCWSEGASPCAWWCCRLRLHMIQPCLFLLCFGLFLVCLVSVLLAVSEAHFRHCVPGFAVSDWLVYRLVFLDDPLVVFLVEIVQRRIFLDGEFSIDPLERRFALPWMQIFFPPSVSKFTVLAWLPATAS